MTLKDINSNSKEGKLLVSALAIISVAQKVEFNPDDILVSVEENARRIYPATFDDERLIDVPAAVKVLREALDKDRQEGNSLFYTYQSNIAMTIVDTFAANLKDQTGKNKEMPVEVIELCNVAAKKFLNNFIGAE